MIFNNKHKKESLTSGCFEVKRLTEREDINSAFKLAEEVFMQFEAPEFSKRGVESFLDFLWGKRVQQMLADGEFAVWGCYVNRDGYKLVGMMALRGGEHISLAFVRADFHRQGVGRMLYSAARKYALERGSRAVTVNASDYGIPFYRAMGFKETDMRLMTDGIVYTPMACTVDS